MLTMVYQRDSRMRTFEEDAVNVLVGVEFMTCPAL